MNSLTFSKGFKGPNLSAILNGPAFAINQRIAQPLLTGARKISNPRAGVAIAASNADSRAAISASRPTKRDGAVMRAGKSLIPNANTQPSLRAKRADSCRKSRSNPSAL